MGALYKETIHNQTTSYGTNLKNIVQWFVRNAGLTVLATNTDTSSVYDVVLWAFGRNEAAIRIYNSSQYVYISTLCRSSLGSMAYGEVTDYYRVDESTYTLYNLYSASGTADCYACVTDTGITCRAAYGSDAIGFSFAKFTDTCDGKTICGVKGSSTDWNWNGSHDGEYGTISLVQNSAVDNGYIRARPAEVSSSSLKLWGHSEDYYQIVQNGAFRGGNAFEEIVIGGHSFVCVSSSYGFYLKIS